MVRSLLLCGLLPVAAGKARNSRLSEQWGRSQASSEEGAGWFMKKITQQGPCDCRDWQWGR